MSDFHCVRGRRIQVISIHLKEFIGVKLGVSVEKIIKVLPWRVAV